MYPGEELVLVEGLEVRPLFTSDEEWQLFREEWHRDVWPQLALQDHLRAESWRDMARNPVFSSILTVLGR